MRTTAGTVRGLTCADLAAVAAVQRACYRDELIESAAAFRGKLMHFPAGCLGLEHDGRLGAYCFCQPWHTGRPLPLDHEPHTEAQDGEPDCLYVHDLAVIPDWRGGGAAGLLLRAVLAIGERERLTRLALVAVQGSEPFWTRRGLQPSYRLHYAPGVPATYMIANLTPEAMAISHTAPPTSRQRPASDLTAA